MYFTPLYYLCFLYLLQVHRQFACEVVCAVNFQNAQRMPSTSVSRLVHYRFSMSARGLSRSLSPEEKTLYATARTIQWDEYLALLGCEDSAKLYKHFFDSLPSCLQIILVSPAALSSLTVEQHATSRCQPYWHPGRHTGTVREGVPLAHSVCSSRSISPRSEMSLSLRYTL